jgi:hypothetical protein
MRKNKGTGIIRRREPLRQTVNSYKFRLWRSPCARLVINSERCCDEAAQDSDPKIIRMDNGTYAQWLATALQFLAAAAAMTYPEQRSVALGTWVIGLAISLGATWIWWDPQWSLQQGGWFLFPLGMATGLALTWAKRGWIPIHLKDYQWRSRPRLEIYEIACRSVGIEPMLPVPDGPAVSVMRLLADAIKDRDLGAVGDVDGDPRQGGGIMTQIPHGSLAEFALASRNDQLLKFVNKWKTLENADFSKLLYPGDIHLDAKNLGHDKVQIAIRCFNGSPGVAAIGSITGEIEYRSPGRGACALGVPILVDGVGTQSGAWGTELFLVCDLTVPTDLAQEIARRLDGEETVVLGFQNLNIACDLGPPIREIVRMPLWNGVKFKKVDGQVCAIGWIIGAAINIVV